ncbi:MAG TPA: TonB-dependent receptor [Spongiibacteraceae bacterium]|nr:TonB-dependent receptor [Spongiibacteraceae bacterium]
MTPRTTVLRYLTIAIAAAGAVSPVFAATETIENIIVTSQAREQTVQEVPIAIQVVTMEQINDLAATNLSEMNGYFPGFTVTGEQPTQANYALRGIGTTDFGIGTDAPVGVYVDGVYTGKTGGALLNFNDVQRVEVLKGPQGTLFGRNSAAGAIAIYTNQPTRDTTANGLVRVGSYGTRYFEGTANSPITDDIAARVSFVNNRSDGWVTNRTTGNKVGNDHDWGSRLAFKWLPTDNTEVTLRWEHEYLDQHARPAFGVVKVPPGATALVPPSAATFVDPFDAPLENDAPDNESRRFDGGTLHVESDIGGLTFQSTTAYRTFKSHNRQDNDGTANIATYLDTTNAEQNTSWQQEFRVAGESDLFDWVSGVSYYYADAKQQSDVVAYTNTIDSLLGVPLFGSQGLLGNTWTEITENGNVTRSYAAFGDAIWHLTPDINLTTGLRWTRDAKDADWYVPPRSAPGLPANEPLAGIDNLIFSGAAQLASSKVSASDSWVNLSPRAVLDYRLSPDSMVFASWSRGFQSGGYDVFKPFGEFDPEYMTNYEVGIKNYFPDVGLTANASVFYYKFTDLQNISLISGQGAVAQYQVDNSDQHAYGLDVDVAYQLNDHVRLFTAAEFINQRYDKKLFTSHFGTNPTIDLADQPVGTPIVTAMAGVNIDWDLFGGIGQFTLQGTHTSEGRCNDQLREEFGCIHTSEIEVAEAQTRVDLRIGWDTSDHKYGTALVVNNVFDQRYVTSAPGGTSTWELGTPYVSITPPRFVGVEFKMGM